MKILGYLKIKKYFINIFNIFVVFCFYLFSSNLYSSEPILAQTVGQTGDDSTETSQYFINFLEIGITQFGKSKKKPPEDLGNVISSIRISNNFLSNQVIYIFQNTEIKDKAPKRKISYTLKPKEDIIFYNLTYNYYDNRLEYRKYLDSQNNFTLDTYINDYKETKIKIGMGPLDYFEDSGEVSFYYFQIVSRGSYRIQTRPLLNEERGLAFVNPEVFLLYNVSNPSTLYFNDGTTETKTNGIGIFTGWNTKFWKIFSIYNIFDFQLFKINGTFSIFTPNTPIYNTQSSTSTVGTQIIFVEKNLDINMNLYYELGFSATIGKVGFKWGWYWTLPLILDLDYINPKGYIINIVGNNVQIQPLETSIALFYKGDPGNKTKTFQIGLSGITFGLVTKF